MVRRRLSVGRRRPRKIDADGSRLRAHRHPARSGGSTSTNSCSKRTNGCAQRARSEEGDPIEPVAEQIAAEAKLLCFDEMQVNNPADAMILSRLFGKLLDEGVKIVTTSNRPPRDLYKDGLNRELFLPFIELIERRMLVVEVNGPTDYRLDRLTGVEVWHVPNGPEATADLPAPFSSSPTIRSKIARRCRPKTSTSAADASFMCPKSLKGVAVFSFKRLCGEPRGAADYLAIARRYHTVIIVGIPVMGPTAQRGCALRHADRRALRA